MSKHAPTKEPPLCLKARRFSAIICTLITLLNDPFSLTDSLSEIPMFDG
jgi:hypothetical protein